MQPLDQSSKPVDLSRLQAKFKPTVICLDLDEFMFVQRILEDGSPNFKPLQRRLSDSAVRELGTTINKDLYYYTQEDSHWVVLQSLARNFFEKRFSEWSLINDVFGDRSPIKIVIITSANYLEEKIKEAFDHFYANGENRFSSNKFPVEFHNIVDLLNDEIYIDGVTEINKGELINRLYPLWYRQMFHNGPPKPKFKLNNRDVWMFDNELFTYNEVKELGYSAYHSPSTLNNRGNVTFAKEGMQTFEVLDRLTDEALGIDSCARKVFFEQLERQKALDQQAHLMQIQAQSKPCCIPCVCF